MTGELQDFFRVGGTLGPDVPSYVVRGADEELPRLVLAGHYCYVLTARQMGKSSLMVRTARRLQAEGVRTATVELTQIGTQGGMDAWYLSFISQIHSQFELAIDYQAWWEKRPGVSSVQRFSDFLRQVVLEMIPGKVVIFIDEIDTTLSLDFSDDFFAAIRAMYNARASDPTYERLAFVLLGVAMPGDLIKDRTRTPFNIGQGIALQEFSQTEGAILQQGLELACPRSGKTLFARIYYWTEGHPYLTQKLCAAAADAGSRSRTEKQVDALVERSFLTEEASRKESNLQFVRDRVRASPDTRQMLRLYRQVWQGKEIPDEERSVVKSRLKLYGLVKATPRGTLVVRNRIYKQVFDLEWIKETMPRDPARWIVAISLLVAVIAIAIAGYLYIQQRQQRAEFYIDQFRTSSSADVRLTSLAGLMALSGYKDDAQRLFFEELTPTEQVDMFTVSDPRKSQEQIVTVVDGLYTRLHDTTSNNRILEGMAAPLQGLSTPKATSLSVEIEQLLEGRTFCAQGKYQDAIDAYDVAIGLNPSNAVTYLDRAQALASLSDYSIALANLEKAVKLDRFWEAQIKQIVDRNPGLLMYLDQHRLQYEHIAHLFPTLTPTPLQTSTMAPTPLPTLTPSSTLPSVSLDPTPIVIVVQTDMQILLGRDSESREKELLRIKALVEPYLSSLAKERIKAGMVLTFGATSSDRPSDGVRLAHAVSDMLRDEWPEIFEEAAFQNYLSFERPVGEVEIRILRFK